jgi:hypothetical protein
MLFEVLVTPISVNGGAVYKEIELNIEPRKGK